MSTRHEVGGRGRLLASLLAMSMLAGVMPASGVRAAGSVKMGNPQQDVERLGAWPSASLPARLWSALRRNLAHDAVTQSVGRAVAATAPLTGTWSQQAELAPAGSSGFGYTLAISGSTAAIGANQGVYVYVGSGGSWTLQQEITSTATYFGSALALSGNTVVIGARGADSNSGAVYVYVRSGGLWTQQAVLTNPRGTAPDHFGSSVALGGNILVAGAGGTFNAVGAAYVYVRGGSTWYRQATLTSSDGVPGDGFGGPIALSGNTVLIAASAKNGNAGAVYAFVRNTTGFTATWSQQAEIAAPACCGNFGGALALEGNTALIGVGAGSAVWVFVRSGTTWTQQMQLTTPSDAVDFGTAIAFSGATALIGAFASNNHVGTAYIFVDTGSTWTQQAELQASDGVGQYDDFGKAVGLSGNTAVIGANLHANNKGAAYVFARS